MLTNFIKSVYYLRLKITHATDRQTNIVPKTTEGLKTDILYINFLTYHIAFSILLICE